MGLEGVVGCEACRELREEAINKGIQESEVKKLEGSAKVTGQRKHHAERMRKSLGGRKKKFQSGERKNEDEWWGPGVNRILIADVDSGEGMFLEELEQDISEKTYSSRKAKSSVLRGVWAEFIKMIRTSYEQALSKTMGPEWFQDLSPKQINLLNKLHEILEADMQEGIATRTQRALTAIGIHPPLQKRDVLECMSECESNIIRFLFILHKLVVAREQDAYDKALMNPPEDGKPVQKYSINERLLLSGVFHLHFKEFTNKLDKLLPPSPEKPALILPNLQPPPPKIRYKSPYLEPQPLPAKTWYEQRLEDELYKEKAQLVALAQKKEFEKKVLQEAAEQKKAKEERLRKLLEQQTYFGTSKTLKKGGATGSNDIAHRENKSEVFKRFSTSGKNKTSPEGSGKNSKEGSESSLIISKSLIHTKKKRRYMYDVIHETAQTRTSFGGFFGKDNKLLKDSEGAHLKIRLVPRNEKVVCLYRDEDFHPVQVLDTRVRTCCRDVGIQTGVEPIFLPLNVNQGAEFYKYAEDVSSQSEASTNTEEMGDEMQGKDNQIKEETSLSDVSKKTINIECPNEACALIPESIIPMDEYYMMRKKFETYSPQKQLKAAVAYLCQRGDPLAILPRIEDTPWLMRWFEKRRGIKEKLTGEEKDLLMASSLRQWESPYTKVSSIVIKPLVIKKKLTTLDKEWLMEKIHSYVYEFQTKLRQQMVNGAREFFPTLYTEYFTSPINRTMRKTFFTYLPSRELDSYVYKVWLQQSRDKKPKSEETT